MNDLITKIITWVKANILMAAGIGLALVFVLFGKQLKRLFFPRRRIRHRRPLRVSYSRRRRSLPRSVGIRRRYNKSGTRKKAWQIKGSPAARRHMAQIRRMR